MADFHKGKVFFILLLFIFRFFLVDSNSLSNEQEDEHEIDESLGVLDRQEFQLKKLEALVKNLTEAIAKLESSLPDYQRFAIGSVENEQHKLEVSSDKVEDRTSWDDLRLLNGEDEVDKISLERDRVSSNSLSVTKYNPSWSERFQFLSAVKLESEAKCINVLPFEDYEGFSKYIAVGDDCGRVYIFLPNGDVLVQFQTLSESPITAMLSYMSIKKNESVLVTGHEDGVILVHRVWEASNGEDWHSLSMENFQGIASIRKGEEGLPITILEVHQVGRTRYILSSDSSGKIRVLRENGTIHGSAMPRSRPLVFLKQRLLFLTESGAGSLDLRSMRIRESECEGMNHSLARYYVFDVSERSKAYGFTSEGDLIHVMLLGDMMNFKCRVRSKRKFEMDEPLVVQAIKGYLIVVGQEKVFVYNVSSQHYIRVGAPRPLFFASLDEIRSSFLYSHGRIEGSKSGIVIPLIASDREKLVVLGLGSGYVGMYRSNLPVFNAEFNTMLWTSPVLLFLLFLFGVWQFFGKKKESLTSWGSEDPFSKSTSAATGSTKGSGSGDRQFARRYISPSRYPAGAAIPFRPSSADPNFRTSSTDQLKYRGPNAEATGYPKRREPLFSNSQVVEDNIDNIN